MGGPGSGRKAGGGSKSSGVKKEKARPYEGKKKKIKGSEYVFTKNGWTFNR
jgi:hypothetical protein